MCTGLQLDQWAEVSRICKEKSHFVVVDMAYQGFATGDLERDSLGLRLLAKDGHKLMLCQSFSKNMGLYGKGRSLMGLYGKGERGRSLMGLYGRGGEGGIGQTML